MSVCGATDLVCARGKSDRVAVAADINIPNPISVTGNVNARLSLNDFSVDIHPALCMNGRFADRFSLLIHGRDATDQQLIGSLPVWHVLRHQRIEPLGVVAFQEVCKFVDNDHFKTLCWKESEG